MEGKRSVFSFTFQTKGTSFLKTLHFKNTTVATVDLRPDTDATYQEDRGRFQAHTTCFCPVKLNLKKTLSHSRMHALMHLGFPEIHHHTHQLSPSQSISLSLPLLGFM